MLLVHDQVHVLQMRDEQALEAELRDQFNALLTELAVGIPAQLVAIDLRKEHQVILSESSSHELEGRVNILPGRPRPLFFVGKYAADNVLRDELHPIDLL